MEISFKGKRALVTGAGRGIGRELTKKLTEYGAQVVALSKSKEPLETLKREIPNVETVCVDISDWNATRQVVESIGHVDFLVNNAGIWSYAPFEQITEEDFDKIFAIHVKGPMNISQIVCKKMKEKGTGGAIVNVSSGLSSKAMAGTTLYGASKAAYDQMTRVMAVELGPHKIRVNSVNPGVVKTEMSASLWTNEAMSQPIKDQIPLRRFSEATDVVNAILYLLSDKASMVHGASLFVDGGADL